MKWYDSDGPAKSFAFRRLRYLDSSWQMYILLNEFQEMADSKVGPFPPLITVDQLSFFSLACLSS